MLALLFSFLVISTMDRRIYAVSEDPQDAEVVELTELTKISFPEKRGIEQTKSWKFKSTSDEPIFLKCDLDLESPQSGECAKESVTVNNGESTFELCGYKPLSLVSIKGEITMTAKLSESTEGHMDCAAGVGTGQDGSPEARQMEVSDDKDAEETTCPCGVVGKSYKRIINGVEADENEYPFMVSLQINGGHGCGASIISPLHILTAAHCVDQMIIGPSEKLRVVVGAHQLDNEDASRGTSKELKAKEFHIHPSWYDRPSETPQGDAAVIVLEEPLEFNDYVGPVCLSPEPLPVVDKYITAMGWGMTEKGKLADQLLHAQVLVIDTNLCNQDERETCFKTEHAASCFGDSGGPYVYIDPETKRYTQVALVSYGYGQCTGDVFIGTNTVYYYDWIRKIVNDTSDHDVCIKAN